MENYKTILKLIRKHRFICLFYGKKFFIKKLYEEKTGLSLDFNHLVTFREKLQLRKLSNSPLLAECADKYLVRSYIKEKIGEEYLPPIYLYKKNLSVDDLKTLPNSFIIKTTSGSGTNIIVKNKSEENLKKLCDTINSYTKIKYGYLWGELFYNKNKNQIIIEKLLTKETVYDYKIHCFRDNQKNLRQIIEVMWGPKNDRHKQMYNDNWEPLSYFFSIAPDNKTFKKPKQLKELLNLSAKLSESFSYVRTDFYIINNKIYFGELTFIPTAGFNGFNPKEYDKIWGSWIGDSIII